MTEGVFVKSLGKSILVEWSASKVKSVCFSKAAPNVHSDLAEEIAAFLEGRGQCPTAKLDMSQCSEFKGNGSIWLYSLYHEARPRLTERLQK